MKQAPQFLKLIGEAQSRSYHIGRRKKARQYEFIACGPKFLKYLGGFFDG
jgi:hypothetical protein